jgi:hypothetical protein
MRWLNRTFHAMTTTQNINASIEYLYTAYSHLPNKITRLIRTCMCSTKMSNPKRRRCVSCGYLGSTTNAEGVLSGLILHLSPTLPSEPFVPSRTLLSFFFFLEDYSVEIYYTCPYFPTSTQLPTMLPRKSTTETSSLYFPTAFTPFEFSMMLFIPVLCILFTCGTVLVTCVLHREIRGKGERWSSAESFMEWDGADKGERRRVVKKSARPV